MSTRSLSAWALVALLAPSSACGLIDSDITNFDLGLPSKQFTIDAGRWMLRNADQLVSQACTTDPDPCAMAAAQACDAETCSARCDGTTSTCDLTLQVALFQEVDLTTEKPELQQIQNQPVIDVTIDAIDYEVSANSLNVDTPELVVYAAPSTVMAPGPMALRIGTVPPVPAGQTRALSSIQFDPMGRANLARFMGDYMTPFNLLVGSSLLVEQGDAIPAGAITMRVSVEAHAGI